MSMLGFVYLVLILGWILIVLFLKCKKSITPHIGLSDNYTDAAIGVGRFLHVCFIFLGGMEIAGLNHLRVGYYGTLDSIL